MLRGLGFWFDDVSPSGLPRPQALVPSGLTKQEREGLGAYLREAPTRETYRGHSWCRFRCGISNEEMGCSERTDGVWCWPEGLPHYVLVHDVRLPEEFVRRALQFAAFPEPTSLAPLADADLQWWTSWTSSNNAVVKIAHPWEVLPVHLWETRSQLRATLLAALDPEDPIARGLPEPVATRTDKDAVLYFLCKTSELVIVDWTKPDGRPLLVRLEGWSAWNQFHHAGAR